MPDPWFENLVKENEEWLIRVLTNELRGDSAAAEDQASKTFRTAWSKQLDIPPDNMHAWLYVLAMGHVRNYRRGVGRAIRLVERIAQFSVGRTSTPSFEDEIAERIDLFQAVSRLSKKDREVLHLRFRAELSSEEIGVVLKISPTAARKRLSRAGKKLRQELGAYYRTGKEG